MMHDCRSLIPHVAEWGGTVNNVLHEAPSRSSRGLQRALAPAPHCCHLCEPTVRPCSACVTLSIRQGGLKRLAYELSLGVS